MVQCNQCKEEVDVDTWKFCPHCGGSLQDERLVRLFKTFFHSKRNVALLVLLQLVFIGSIGYLYYHSKSEVARKQEEIKKLLDKKREVFVETKTIDKIFPIAYAGDNMKMGELFVTSPIYGRLKVETEITGITDHETRIVTIKPEGGIYPLNPTITESGYRALNDSQKKNLLVKVTLMEDDGQEKVLLDEKKEIFLYSRNDILWQDKDGKKMKYAVRWINKDKDEIKELVRKAADHMKEVGSSENALIGALGDRKETEREIAALFLAMSRDMQIRYVLAPFSYDDPNAQKIKTPEEVVRTKSGLCVELALLMAAAYEHIGLNGVLIMVPGHAWVGVEVGPRTQDYIFIETTALEKTPQEAMAIGQENWDRIKGTANAYELLNVNELRAEGLEPMRY